MLAVAGRSALEAWISIENPKGLAMGGSSIIKKKKERKLLPSREEPCNSCLHSYSS